MRDGIPRSRRTNAHRAGAHENAPVLDWRRDVRPHVLRDLAERVSGLTWTRPLLFALLDELYVNDEFDRLIGPLGSLALRDGPRLAALALLLRHSWDPDDLADLVIGLALAPITNRNPRLNSSRRVRDRARRRHTRRRTSAQGRRALKGSES
jgi:hypothetical protein